MSTPAEIVLAIGGLLLIVSVLVSKVSDRFGVPALLLFLLLGMLAGSDGPGGIYFDDPALTQFVGVVALVFIFFSGGLDTDWRSIRPALKQGISLATIGVVLTAVDEFLVSTGSTVIQAADTLLILADQDQFRQVADALTGRAAE